MVIAVIICILAIALGIMFCFFGYRYLRKLITGFGFLIGAITAYILLSPTMALFPTIILSVVIGAATGLLLYYIHVAGIFLLGVFFGIASVSILCILFSWNPFSLTASIFMLVSAIVMGVMAVIYRRNLIVICTAFTGGMLTALCCGYLLLGDPSGLTVKTLFPSLKAYFTDHSYWCSIAGAALSAAGMLIQFVSTANVQRKKR